MKTFRLIKTKHQVHILYSLSCGTLYKIIHCSHHDDTFRSRIDLEINIYIVASFYAFCLRTHIFIQNTHKCLIFIIFVIDCLHFLIGNFFLKRSICSYQNTSVHWDQMRCKVDQNFLSACISKLILYLRSMSVSCHTVCFDIFIYFAVKIGNLGSSSGS